MQLQLYNALAETCSLAYLVYDVQSMMHVREYIKQSKQRAELGKSPSLVISQEFHCCSRLRPSLCPFECAFNRHKLVSKFQTILPMTLLQVTANQI